MNRKARLVTAAGLAPLLILASLLAYAGRYGLHVLFRHGGTYWLQLSTNRA